MMDIACTESLLGHFPVDSDGCQKEDVIQMILNCGSECLWNELYHLFKHKAENQKRKRDDESMNDNGRLFSHQWLEDRDVH